MIARADPPGLNYCHPYVFGRERAPVHVGPARQCHTSPREQAFDLLVHYRR